MSSVLWQADITFAIAYPYPCATILVNCFAINRLRLHIARDGEAFHPLRIVVDIALNQGSIFHFKLVRHGYIIAEFCLVLSRKDATCIANNTPAHGQNPDAVERFALVKADVKLAAIILAPTHFHVSYLSAETRHAAFLGLVSCGIIKLDKVRADAGAEMHACKRAGAISEEGSNNGLAFHEQVANGRFTDNGVKIHSFHAFIIVVFCLVISQPPQGWFHHSTCHRRDNIRRYPPTSHNPSSQVP